MTFLDNPKSATDYGLTSTKGTCPEHLTPILRRGQGSFAKDQIYCVSVAGSEQTILERARHEVNTLMRTYDQFIIAFSIIVGLVLLLRSFMYLLGRYENACNAITVATMFGFAAFCISYSFKSYPFSVQQPILFGVGVSIAVGAWLFYKNFYTAADV
jgi:hypothetical protein